MQISLKSDEGVYWDNRYRLEGVIWREEPSPTAVLAAGELHPGARVLDVGFGYGRDLQYLLGKGLRASGIEISEEGHRQAQARLCQRGLKPEALLHGDFEECGLSTEPFDGLISHRMAHLLVTREAIAQFVHHVRDAVTPGGLVCLGVRNSHDLNPDDMILVGDNVYEYRSRPGHRIRYWDDWTFEQAFGTDFEILSLTHVTEIESALRPVPCFLTVMMGHRR